MNTLSPRRTLVTTFSPGTSSLGDSYYDDGAYILHIATSNESSSFVTCALSDQSVRVFDRVKFEPRTIITQAHTAPITDLCHVGDSLVVSSGYDGFVKLFDLRMATPDHSLLELKLPNREQALSTSVGYGGTLVAVGSAKSKIHFFDIRMGKDDRRIGCYVDAHTDEVTKVRFQACFGIHDSSLLVSASEDGLACIHDTRQTTEENALVSVMNLMNPIREVGFFGPSGEGLFCLTGSETMSVWHHESAQRIYDFGSIRDNLALKCEFSIDYLVNCYWDNVGMNLNLLAGNSSGDAAIFHVDVGSISLSKRLLGGHKGCIRATTLCPTTMHQNILYTVGEDSRLCEWFIDEQREEMTLGEHNSPELSSNTEKQSTVGPVRKPKSKHTHKPY